MAPVGFVILTHRNPSQLERLVRVLNRVYDNPPVVCHHDFSKCPLETNNFGPNVEFVRPHFITGWADFSVVDATVAAIKRMYTRPDAPKFVTVISGSDYPVKPADKVILDLETAACDAFIYHLPVTFGRMWSDQWIRKCFVRYRTSVFDVPSLDKKFRPRRRQLKLWLPLYTARTSPFSPRLRCYAGRQWFTINRRAAECILDFHQKTTALAQHYRKIIFSEESYFQTILCNRPELHIANQDWRFVKFTGDYAHPNTLRAADLDDILRSSAHFARKFDPTVDEAVLSALDDYLTGVAVQRSAE